MTTQSSEDVDIRMIHSQTQFQSTVTTNFALCFLRQETLNVQMTAFFVKGSCFENKCQIVVVQSVASCPSYILYRHAFRAVCAAQLSSS